VQDYTGKAPSALDWNDLGVEVISSFLDHLETDRHNSARSRNAVAVSLCRTSPPRTRRADPAVLAIPQKRSDKTIVSFLEPDEVDALLAAPDLSRWEGRRDRALLVLATQTGLRLSELTGINCGDSNSATERTSAAAERAANTAASR
jgi:site-specific recombinase XerD